MLSKLKNMKTSTANKRRGCLKIIENLLDRINEMYRIKNISFGL